MKNTGIPGTQGAFPDKVSPNIDGFTDKPVVQYDVQAVEKTEMINRFK